MHYYGTRLSENISKREPEGYLLCLNVPVARTGVQEYLPEELGLTSGSSLIQVFRPEEEVFSEATMASFEGMPVTNDHPPLGVDVSNIRALQKGHAHNVRRGSGEESDLLLADLIITDPALITAILEEGKREISCGYTYELREENGRYIQRQIRGNHVAVVDAGRAGPRVCIKDEQPSKSSIWETDTASSKVATPHRGACFLSLERGTDGTSATGSPQCLAHVQPPGLQPGMRRSHHKANTTRLKGVTAMKKSLSKVLARMAKDGDIETVAEIIEEMIEPENNSELPGEETETVETPAAVVETEAGNTIAVDEDALGGIIERLDRIIALLEPAPAADEVPEEIAEATEEAVEAAEQTENPAAGEVSAVMEEILDPVASVILENEADEEEQELPEVLRTGDALRAALAAVRPVLARMPRNMRQRMAGDIAANLRRARGRGTTGADAYAALASARRRTAPASAELGKKIMASRNSNYKRQEE